MTELGYGSEARLNERSVARFSGVRALFVAVMDENWMNGQKFNCSFSKPPQTALVTENLAADLDSA
jgi:hypothetical protein